MFARFLGIALRLLCSTLRWRVEGLEHLASSWGAGAPVIIGCWHGRLVMLPFVWLKHGKGEIQVLMGRNRNGELISRIVRRFNMLAIRGGSRTGGGEAREEMALAVAANPATTLALTPDGPHGPPGVSKMGIAHLSRTCGLPVVWVSAAASFCVRLPTWDRMQLPLPGSRVTVRFAAPMLPAAFAADSLEEYRVALETSGRAALEGLDRELGLRS